MFSLRCTRRLLARLKVSPTAGAVEPTTRLGDWYANVLHVGRRQLLLAASERSFLPVVIAATPGNTLIERFPVALAEVLRAIDIEEPSIDRELAEMDAVTIGQTVNRQVTGVLVDFAKALPCYLDDGLSLLECSLKLAGTPLGPLRGTTGFPDRATAALFQGRRSDATPPKPRAVPKPAADDRPEVQALFANLKMALPALEQLLAERASHWGYEDAVYRFYHQSFKVYALQGATMNIFVALQALAPGRELNEWFVDLVKNGTGKQFEVSHNANWLEVTRPIVEAYFHAHYFLEMAVRYGKTLKEPPIQLPSGWAALLYLYRLR